MFWHLKVLDFLEKGHFVVENSKTSAQVYFLIAQGDVFGCLITYIFLITFEKIHKAYFFSNTLDFCIFSPFCNTSFYQKRNFLDVYFLFFVFHFTNIFRTKYWLAHKKVSKENSKSTTLHISPHMVFTESGHRPIQSISCDVQDTMTKSCHIVRVFLLALSNIESQIDQLQKGKLWKYFILRLVKFGLTNCWGFGGKEWMNQLMNHEAVSRTAPASPGLLSIAKKVDFLVFATHC